MWEETSCHGGMCEIYKKRRGKHEGGNAGRDVYQEV